MVTPVLLPDVAPSLRFTANYKGDAAPEPEDLDNQKVGPELPPWTGEPTSIEGVMDRYHIEAKVSGRVAGSTLILVNSKDRSGKLETCHSCVILFFGICRWSIDIFFNPVLSP